MNWFKKFGSALLSLLLLFGSAPVLAAEPDGFSISAEQNPDQTENSGEEETPENPEQPITPPQDADPAKTGSITVSLEESEKNLDRENVEFALYRVADIENGEYVLVSPFEDSGVDLNSLQTANELLEAADTFARLSGNAQAEKTAYTDAEGTAVFADLPAGVYLLSAVSIAGYELIDPTLIAIPTYDYESGQMSYDVQVMPKHSKLLEIQIRKTDSSTGSVITQKDFSFGVYSDPDCKNLIQTLTADTASGTVQFPISFGTVYVKEVSAPSGYVLSDEVVKIEFRKEDHVILINNVEQTPDSDFTVTIEYKNTPVITPQKPYSPGTAAKSQMILWIALMLCAAGFGFWFIRRKKADR